MLNIHRNNLTGKIPFQDCKQSPRFMEADCDAPQKIACPCCTNCHGIFPPDDDELGCSSGEFALLFEDLVVNDYLGISFSNSASEIPTEIWDSRFEYFEPANTTHRETRCVSVSGCYFFKIMSLSLFTKSIKLSVSIDNDVVFEDILSSPDEVFQIGFHSDGTMKKDSCDNFTLCSTTIRVNSTKRELVNKVTGFTGVQVFSDTSSSYHSAACNWITYLEDKDDEELKDIALTQYFYLALLFYETNGNRWSNSNMWVQNTNFCNWYGIKCDRYGIVTSIRLPSNNLKGTLPTEIGELRGLKHISLGDNHLSGTMPFEIGVKLTTLNEFNVSYNSIWGSIPMEFSRLRDLVKLDTSHNQLTGRLPDQIGNLNKLQVFNVFNNTCAGSIPTALSNLYELKELSLGSNLFTGSASLVRKLFNLEFLDLSQNLFTGNVPLGSLHKKLRVLQLSSNRFQGSIPPSIEILKSLETLYLHHNLLTGNLPSEIGNLEHLTHVSLSNNGIKGVVPSEIGKLKNLTLLHLQNNQLGGSGDFFDYTVGDYIADCGNTFTGAARIECTICSSCCNVNGDCISKEITWPGSTVPATGVSPKAFVFLMVLAGCLVFLICILFYQLVLNSNSDFDGCHEFQVQSVYRFFLTKSIGAIFCAAATLTIQLVLLSIFLEASDFTAAKNDWEYSMSCPNDSVSCEDKRLISPSAWFSYSCVMFSYLANDFVESIKMIHRSILLKSGINSVFAGFVVLYFTMCSALVSVLYSYSTATSNTDILTDAVVLLFMNELDERLYLCLKLVRPIWVEERNQEIKARFTTMTKGKSRRAAANLSDTAGTNEEQQNSGCDLGSNLGDSTHQEGSGLNRKSARICLHQKRNGTNTNKEMKAGAKHEFEIADCISRVREHKHVLVDFKNDLTYLENAHTESQNDHKEMEQKFANLEQEICDVSVQIGREIGKVKKIIRNS